MPDPDLTAALAQLGAAGLIGWMWLSERRAAAARERQLSQLHDRLMQERLSLSALVSVVRDNTRALAALDAGQRSIAAAMDRLARRVHASARRARANTTAPRA
jgi:hypothetical protein